MKYLEILETADLAHLRAERLTALATTRQQQAYAAEQRAHAAAVRRAAVVAQLCEEYIRALTPRISRPYV